MNIFWKQLFLDSNKKNTSKTLKWTKKLKHFLAKRTAIAQLFNFVWEKMDEGSFENHKYL